MKKTLSLLLVLALALGLLAGCGGAQSPASTGEAPAESAASIQESAAAAPEDMPGTNPDALIQGEPVEPASAEEPAPEPEEELPQFVEVELPITEEPATFSIWYTWPPVLTNFIEGPGATPFAQELESRTGVHIDYQIVNTETASADFSLMVAAGDYPDMILGASSYYNNPDQLLEDGVAVNVEPYLDDLMPNLKAVLAQNKDWELAAYTDSGAIVECYRFEIGTEMNVGPVIRKEYLEKLGKDVPVTYDEYHDVLSAFKNEIGASAPLLMPYTGLTNYFSVGYGVPAELRNGLFYVQDGQVKYAGMEQDYYDFVTLMAKWFEEGLIDPDFLSRTTSTDPDFGLIAAGDAGVWTANVLMFDMYKDAVDDPDFAITGTSYPRKTADGPVMYVNDASPTNPGYTVTTDCHDVETCLKWIDYWYSQEGTFLANYGLEGVSFEYDENGDPHLNETILQSPIGLPSSLTCSIYITNGGPYVNDCARLQYYFGENQKAAMEIWDRSGMEICSEGYPADAGLTTEEAEEYAAVMSDIETYMEEIVTSVLVGNEPVSKLDEVADNLTAMRIQEAIDLKQAAYDRYLAKAD